YLMLFYRLLRLLNMLFMYFLRNRRSHKSTLFPYTTLFRSQQISELEQEIAAEEEQISKEQEKLQEIRSSFKETEMKLVSVNDNRSEEHTSELQSRFDLVCRLLLEKKKKVKMSVILTMVHTS